MLDKRSKALRETIIHTLAAGGRGHIGAALSIVEILRVLYDHIMHFDSQDPNLPTRDRCILSKGHGCLALYSILADKGFFPYEDLHSFCETGSLFGGHPEIKIPGVEASTGSLGHGLSIGLGMAIAARIDKRKSNVYVIVGDGESNEGSIWEAALSAGKNQTENLTVLVDYNKQQSYGSTKYVQDMEPFANKWESFGFACQEVDGHDIYALRRILTQTPFEANKPSAIICHTIKGKGIKGVEGDLTWHHKSKIKEEDISFLRKGLLD